MEKEKDNFRIEINQNAPVIASCKTLIHTEIDEVWEHLSDINRWPMWVSSVSDSFIKGDLKPGSSFIWSKNSLKIHSTILNVTPKKSLAWSGSIFGIRAVHTWKLEQLEENNTVVRTVESMEGLVARWFIRSHQLEKIPMKLPLMLI